MMYSSKYLRMMSYGNIGDQQIRLPVDYTIKGFFNHASWEGFSAPLRQILEKRNPGVLEGKMKTQP